MADILQVQGINEKGFGIIPKLVMQDKRLTAEAKAIYSYFCSYAGAGKTAFPGRNKIVSDLGMSKSRFYRHFTLLKEHGYIHVRQEISNRFERNIYTLLDSVPCTHFEDTHFEDTQNEDSNNNSIKSNSINNNSQVSLDGHDLTETIKQSIDYHSLTISHAADQTLIDEIILIMIDCLLSKGEYVRIKGEDKPRELVNSVLIKLDYWNIEHVIERFKSVTEHITNKRQYILTLLYNSKMETGSHMTNLVISDLHRQ